MWAVFFHYPHYYPTTTPVSSIRRGDWKLLEYFETGEVELYHLAGDLGEQNNLARRQPDTAQALRNQLRTWRTQVNAQLPTPSEVRP